MAEAAQGNLRKAQHPRDRISSISGDAAHSAFRVPSLHPLYSPVRYRYRSCCSTRADSDTELFFRFGALALLLLRTLITPSPVLLIALWCFAAMGIWGFMGTFWSLPNEFLAGSSAAAGIALINSFGNIGSFVGPYPIGAINERTGSFYAGLILASISLFVSATLIVTLRKRNTRTKPENSFAEAINLQ